MGISSIFIKEEEERLCNNNQQNEEEEEAKREEKIEKDSQNLFEIICFGYIYQKAIFFIYSMVVLNALFSTNLKNMNGFFTEILHLTVSSIFTLHTVLIYMSNRNRFQIERKHTWIMFFHLLSGPIALLFDLYSLTQEGSINIGGIFKLLKVFTVTREIIMGAIMIFPTLLPAFLGIISFIFILSLWAASDLNLYGNFWVDFNTSVYTYVQILTLDDWAAKLVKDLLKEEKYYTPVVFVLFIFVANYFFLNMMIAFSCETFKKVTNEDYVFRKQRKQIDFYEQETNYAQKGEYCSISNLYKDFEVIQQTHLKKYSEQLLKDIGSQKILIKHEKQLMKVLLDAKNKNITLNQTINFYLNGKTVSIKQKDLFHLKFLLCDSSVQNIEQSQLTQNY